MAQQSTDSVFDASDPIQVKAAVAKTKRARTNNGNDLRAVLSTVEGQRLVWRLMGECGIHQDSFNSNALVMARNEGRRSIGIFIEMEVARECPEKFLEMQLLASKEETNG